MKIYTKTGDNGETGLLGGVRVSKNHLAVETCGTIDELNCHIGLVRSNRHNSCDADDSKLTTSNESVPDLDECLTTIQCQLFDLGSRVAACLADPAKPVKVADLGQQQVLQLEQWIDRFDSQLPPLTAFILPSGTRCGCELHLARTVCRRAERALVNLTHEQAGGASQRDFSMELIYLNRLSDLLFVLARFVNQRAGQSETPWQANR